MSRTLVQQWIEDVRLVVLRTSPPSPREFDEHLAEAVAMADRTRVGFVVMVGDGADCQVDFEQRAKLSAAGLFSKRTAILAPSVRPELVTSQKWVGAEVRAFPPDAFQRACDFLEIAPSLRSALLDALVAAKEQLGPADDEPGRATVSAQP